MPTTKNLHDLFLDELRDAYSGEKQLTKALPKLAKGASSDDLRDALTSHLEETHGQIARLEKIFGKLGEKARGKHCAGLAGIIEEGADVLEEDAEPFAMDAAIIASGQRAEHYEMAAYGSLIAWADALGLPQVSQLLQQTLDEEKAADEKLTELAEAGINEMAAASEPGDEEDDDDAPKASRKSSKNSKSAKKTAAPARRGSAKSARK
jgi:ferritin-like metal-binding protein YciE